MDSFPRPCLGWGYNPYKHTLYIFGGGISFVFLNISLAVIVCVLFNAETKEKYPIKKPKIRIKKNGITKNISFCFCVFISIIF